MAHDFEASIEETIIDFPVDPSEFPVDPTEDEEDSRSGAGPSNSTLIALAAGAFVGLSVGIAFGMKLRSGSHRVERRLGEYRDAYKIIRT